MLVCHVGRGKSDGYAQEVELRLEVGGGGGGGGTCCTVQEGTGSGDVARIIYMHLSNLS